MPLLRLKKRQLDLPKQTCHMVCIKDCIRHCLTGMLATDYTDVSCTDLLNIRDKQFDPEISELLDIREYFRLACALILQSFETSGFVTSQVAIRCSPPEGMPVAVRLYDIDSCYLASSILDSSCLCLIAGIWFINEYSTDDLEGCIGKNDNTIAFLPGYYVIEESSPTSTSNFNQYTDHFLNRMYPSLERRELYDCCNKSIPESGLKQTDILFMPYLSTSNSVPDAKGAFLSLDSSHSPMDILLAVYEETLFSSCYHIEKLVGAIYPQKQIRLSGGTTNSPVQTQILADILQLPMQIMEGKERGAPGATTCVSVACEYYPDFHSAMKKMYHLSRTCIPDSSKAVFHKEKYEKFKGMIQALEAFYRQESRRTVILRTERLQAIVDITNKEKIVISEELTHQLNISKAVARRDIEELFCQGLIQKTRGDTMSVNYTSLGPSFVERRESNADEKARIVRAVREHINPDEKIILDSGTTVLEFIKLVNDIPNLIVVTNNLHIAPEVSIFPSATLLMVGGAIRKEFNSIYGYFAGRMPGSISVNKTFPSIDVADIERGLLSYITDDTNIKKQYIRFGKEVILLCDHTKFQASTFINISQLDCIHRIIVEKELNGGHVGQLGSVGIDVELV